MSDDTMPERLWIQQISYNGFVRYDGWEEPKDSDTEYIRADVAQAQIDAANARIAELESLYRTMQNLSDVHGLLHGNALARIAELEAAQQWVSVDERLPDVDEVLAYSRDEWGYDVWEIDSYSFMQRRWLNDATPTHWMPLPPPPVTDVTP